MSCFLLPKEITKKLQGAIAKSWWSTKANNRGLHRIPWEKICKSYDKGGLGFRDLSDSNLALFAKQLWRLLQHPASLLARVLKGRYYRHTNPMEVKTSNSPSFGWKSIWQLKICFVQIYEEGSDQDIILENGQTRGFQ